MQYLLSEEEMAAIRDERERLSGIPCRGNLVEALANVCKMVATTMVPTAGTAFQTDYSLKRTKPYGCHPR